ncbi:hypothetical protein BX661DRAFT_218727 [Kickxella alabastrina]|uniref:uncharacterized protein n=1 Tax=Kickxella alabastrina TaxID=61397 RepID=UPI00221EC902|nr:uncharacterized protein BX661DRAFT_218727 [Kickxella alabastrina]KAI7819659.1 hypothetical protein BX661DRAFT_218727 [Kickxella alabastrina]
MFCVFPTAESLVAIARPSLLVLALWVDAIVNTQYDDVLPHMLASGLTTTDIAGNVIEITTDWIYKDSNVANPIFTAFGAANSPWCQTGTNYLLPSSARTLSYRAL